jgi:Aldehyde dehydrogenase family
VLNVVTTDRAASAALVRDPRVDKVSFTGSNAVGRDSAAACADRMARVALELGGKSAALLGMQFVGRLDGEPTRLSLASQLESHQPWDDHRPAL